MHGYSLRIGLMGGINPLTVARIGAVIRRNLCPGARHIREKLLIELPPILGETEKLFSVAVDVMYTNPNMRSFLISIYCLRMTGNIVFCANYRPLESLKSMAALAVANYMLDKVGVYGGEVEMRERVKELQLPSTLEEEVKAFL